MTWFAQSANEFESAKPHVALFVAVDFDFPSGHHRYWSGAGELVISGNTYLGVGALGKIATPADNDRLVAEKKTYQLTGVDPAIIPESDIDNCYGRDVVEYFGFLDPESKQLIAQPEINWQGTIDMINRKDGPNPIIEVSAEHRVVLLDRSDGTLYTQEHQQQFFPGDNGFDQVPTLALKTVLWGGQRVYVMPNNTNGGGSAGGGYSGTGEG